jgi:CDGSH-type Zn-finger protein
MITIKVAKTGPLIISPEESDEVRIVDHEGNPVPFNKPGKPLKLCRCGASTTKPFCDGTHSRIGFLAAEAAQQEMDAPRQN